ncbi:MAG: membrane protein insertase YidC [Ignavibacteriae bacterium]|nr:membrane protein insertase YidC [Ignavibacteriota bacterium]MCB9216734.1 membrane protein insertase YidC [Ignavibacteria bacterium]
MDKRTFAAFILIGAVFLIWSFFFSPKPEPPKSNGADTVAKTESPADTSGGGKQGVDSLPVVEAPQVDSNDPYRAWKQGDERYLTIETPLYTALLNTKGGLLARFTLKKYKAWYGAPVQLINDSAGFPGELGVTLKMADDKDLDTRQFYFDIPEEETITLGENDSVVITARLASPAAGEGTTDSTGTQKSVGAFVEKRFVFRGDHYDIDFNVQAPESKGYELDWQGGLKYQEHNSVDESSQAKAYVKVNEELKDLNAELDVPNKTESFTGPIDWVGTKTKYFAAALLPQTPLTTTATLRGNAAKADSNGLVESYDFSLMVPSGSQNTNFTLFLGPLEYDIAREHDLTGMVSYGFLEIIVRPIAEYVLLPLFRLLHSFIANWGIVIIVFSLLIRGALWPLSIPQIKSSEKMRLVQPVITEMREKYKDDPQKMQMETMKVYREYGVNPVGGCLPLVLQLPVLYALWTTLSNAIDLRQADFAFWIHDLSVPDTLIHLPFSLPLIGTQLSGLALIMGATLFIQQKLMITDPKQKMIVYIMPIFLTIAFNHFPSGLNLYYFTYNLLSIAQHYYMRSQAGKSGLTLEQLKEQSKGKKKGWLATKMEEAQKMAEMQGRVPPNKKK